MPKQKSAYAELLTSLGFTPDDELDEESAGILGLLPKLPDVPLVLRSDGDSASETFVMVVDETGALWGAKFEEAREPDLSKHGFGDYVKFCKKKRPTLN